MKRLEYIDGLRGLAVCGVIIIHVGQVVQSLPVAVANFAAYGLRGVQLFFIVSAFTLSTTTFGRDFDPKAFYIRRFFRIAPMFYLAAIFYLTVQSLWPAQPPQPNASILDVVLTFTFLHGLTPSSINKVVPGGWSIACEALFYATFPLVLMWMKDLKRSLLAAAASIFISIASRPAIKLLLSDYDAASVDQFIHFGFLTNLPAFVGGVTIHHLLNSRYVNQIGAWAGHAVLAIATLALLGAACSGIGPLQHPVIAAPLLCLFVIGTALSRSSIIDNRIMRHIGTVSFSIYLLHFIVIRVLEELAPHVLTNPTITLLVSYLTVLAVSTLLATVTYRYVEEPMIAFAKAVTSGRATDVRSGNSNVPRSPLPQPEPGRSV